MDVEQLTDDVDGPDNDVDVNADSHVPRYGRRPHKPHCHTTASTPCSVGSRRHQSLIGKHAGTACLGPHPCRPMPSLLFEEIHETW